MNFVRYLQSIQYKETKYDIYIYKVPRFFLNLITCFILFELIRQELWNCLYGIHSHHYICRAVDMKTGGKLKTANREIRSIQLSASFHVHLPGYV